MFWKDGAYKKRTRVHTKEEGISGFPKYQNFLSKILLYLS